MSTSYRGVSYHLQLDSVSESVGIVLLDRIGPNYTKMALKIPSFADTGTQEISLAIVDQSVEL